MANQNDYWLKRERAHEAELRKDQSKVTATIVKQLQAQRIEIMNLIAAFWGRYAGSEGITRAEAYKQADKLDVQAFADKAATYVKKHDFSKQANEELKLYNLKMKVSRYELLLNQINLELVKLSTDNIDQTQKFLTKSAVSEYERQAGILGPSAKLNKSQIESLVTANHDGATFMDRWYNQGQDIGAKLDMVLRQAIVSGKHPLDFADQVAKRFKVAGWQAERLLITETAYLQTDVQQKSFTQSGFEEGMLVAESNACTICAGLDGKKFKLKDLESGVNAPPMHPNCRCSIVPVMDDEAVSKLSKLSGQTAKGNSRIPKYGKTDMLNREGKDSNEALKRITPDSIERVMRKFASAKSPKKETLYDNRRLNWLYGLSAEKGFNKLPHIVAEKDFDKVVGDSAKIFRWTTRYNELVKGKLEYSSQGHSLHGQAIYFGNANANIDGYEEDGATRVEATLSDDALIVNEADLRHRVSEAIKGLSESSAAELARLNETSIDKIQSLKIYDAVAIQEGIDAYYSHGGYVMVLNREKLVIKNDETT